MKKSELKDKVRCVRRPAKSKQVELSKEDKPFSEKTLKLDSPQDFPRLNEEALRRYALRWVEKYPNLPIEAINLFWFSSQYPEHFQGIPTKYVIVFEVSSACPADDEAYRELLRATEYYQTVPERHPFSRLIDEGFAAAVYKEAPPEDFRQDWLFLPHVSPECLPNFVMTKEPSWALFRKSSILGEQEHSALFHVCGFLEDLSAQIRELERQVQFSGLEYGRRKEIESQLELLERIQEHLGRRYPNPEQSIAKTIKGLEQDRLKEVCAEALQQGYVKISDLSLILGMDDAYSEETLRKLWEELQCDELAIKTFSEVLGTAEAYSEKLGTKEKAINSDYIWRSTVWMFVLDRWTRIFYPKECCLVEDDAYRRYGRLKHFSYSTDRCDFEETQQKAKRDDSGFVALSELLNLLVTERLPTPSVFLLPQEARKEVLAQDTTGSKTSETEDNTGCPRVIFRQARNGMWEIGLEEDVLTFGNLNGFHYIRHLLKQEAGQRVSSAQLYALTHHGSQNQAHRALLEPTGEILARFEEPLEETDEETVRELRDKWKLLGLQIEDEERKSGFDLNPEEYLSAQEESHEKIKKLQDERDKIEKKLNATVSRTGKIRTRGSSKSKYRTGVRKAITTALSNIITALPTLKAFLLYKRTIHTGYDCYYSPSPKAPVEWILE